MVNKCCRCYCSRTGEEEQKQEDEVVTALETPVAQDKDKRYHKRHCTLPKGQHFYQLEGSMFAFHMCKLFKQKVSETCQIKYMSHCVYVGLIQASSTMYTL